MAVEAHARAPEKVTPVLQFSVLCDAVSMGPGNKPVFVGVFDSFTRLARVPQFFIVNRWINGIGEFTQRIDLLDPALKVISPPKPLKFKLIDRASGSDIYSAFTNSAFASAGVHWVSIYLDDELVLSYPVPVRDVRPATQTT